MLEPTAGGAAHPSRLIPINIGVAERCHQETSQGMKP